MPFDPTDLAARVARKERAAIGAALSAVEDRRPASGPAIAQLLRKLASESAVPSLRVGFTGPPGVGKSSLVATLSREFRARGLRVGVLAVDPSSPRSGGALLGDRARIDPASDDDGLFVRSMASGGELGGLARAALSAVEVLSASHDVVLIETVGVGQSETDVELVADLTCVVLQPESGDTLQYLKAGILEIPDLFVLNKSDLPSAWQARGELLATLKLARAGASRSGVVMTSASQGEGIGELADAIEAVRTRLRSEGVISRRRRDGMIAWCQRSLGRRVGELGVELLGGRRAVGEEISRGIDRGQHGLEVVAGLAEKVASAWMDRV